jgi:hypothetical protein
MALPVETWVALGSAFVSSGAIGYIHRSSVRLEVLERLFEEKKTTVETLRTSHDSMDKRLALVESAVVGLNEAIPEMRKFGQVAERLTLLLEINSKRLDALEDRAAAKE